jgi:FKBP-type peptidyl-prolyl cis-trans isomerase FklB
MPVVLAIAMLAAGCAGNDETLPGEPGSRISYSIGYQIGGDFRRQDVDIDPEIVLRGIEDAMAGGEPRMQVEEMQSALVELQRRTKAEDRATPQTGAAGGPVDAESFMAANARQPGVETLPSGLQYKVLEHGSGDSPGAEDTVTVHYRGSLTDGSEFDSSYRRGQPATFAVNRVIAGWTEALQLMREGDKWQLFIPPGLAYGERGAGSRIPPNSALVFEVELIDVK